MDDREDTALPSGQDECALVAAGALPLRDFCAEGYLMGELFEQRPLRINAKAHPAALAALALSRAQRCEAFAGLLENVEATEATFQLYVMTQELVAILRVLLEHDLVARAGEVAVEVQS